MKTVHDILESKGRDVWTIDPGETVREALTKMADKEIGALVVTEGDSVIGVISERDYARKVILEGKSSKTSTVSEIMTTRVLCVSPDRTADECMALMTDKRSRHLPVVDHKKVVGVISIGDLVKAVISEQQVLIDQLQHYITS